MWFTNSHAMISHVMLKNFLLSQKDLDKNSAIDTLIEQSSPNREFFLQVLFSILMASFGLMTNSVAVIIGSMLIAPVLYPVIGIGMGLIMYDLKLTLRSLTTLGKSLAIAILASFLIGLFWSNSFYLSNSEITERITPSLIHAVIAIIAGLAGTYALVRPNLNVNLPAVAISVSLVPPIAVTGLGISKFDWPTVTGSLGLFLVNALGIIFSSMFMFAIMNFQTKRKTADKAIKKEDASLKKESSM